MANYLRPVKLVNPGSRKRRNVAAGYHDEDGYFHPIRASYDYDPKRAGEKGKRRGKRKNPGKRLTLLQKLHFGSKRQRAAAAARLHGKRNPSRYRYDRGPNRKVRKAEKHGGKGSAKAKYYRKRSYERAYQTPGHGLHQNVGEIITIRPLHNTGKTKRRTNKVKNMAKSHKRRMAGLKAARTRKRRASMRRASRHTTHNPSHRRRSTRAYRRRRSYGNASVVRHHRRHVRRNR